MGKLFIGLDFGSDSVRSLLVTERGEELASCVHPYARWAEGKFCDAAHSRFRQHPLDYLEGLETVIKGVLKDVDVSQVAGIGVDTTGSTPCATDGNGVPLALKPEFAENPNAMFLLWKDHTGIGEAARINEVAKSWGGIDYTMYEGGIYSSEWFWSKLLHILRADGKICSAARGFVEHCDWITATLAGTKVKPSRCAAGHKAMWHASWGGLPCDDFLRKIDPLLEGWRDRLFTETYTADVPVGTLCPEWAEKLGLSENVVIAGGLFDCHAGAVGAGVEPYHMVKVIGTSTCDIIVAPEVTHCVRGICGQVDGSVIPGMTGLEAGQSAFGDVYAWFKRFLSYGGNRISLPALEEEASRLPDSEVMALDWLNGRRTPDANQHLTGVLFGLNLGTTAPMAYRALVESTAFGARAIAERFEEENIPIRGVSAIGGIAKKSPFVMQFCADAMNKPIKVAKSDQACALGAAIFAAAASKAYPDVPSAMKAMASGTSAVYVPEKNCDERYARYKRYAAAMEKEMNL